MAGVEFGVFDLISQQPEPLNETYRKRYIFVEAAEELGFYAYHLGEHQFSPLSMAPSPALFLAAAARSTRRIRLGPLVYLVPCYNPARLIEEVCMLDHLTDGRLELGLGRGVSPHELRYWGLDPDESRAMFHEALTILIAGLTSERLSFDGRYYHYKDAPMELQPLQRPYPPLWYASDTPATIPWLAAHGISWVTGVLLPVSEIRPNVERYWQEWEAHRNDAGRLNAHVTRPRVGVTRLFYVAETDAEAERAARPAFKVASDQALKISRSFGDTEVERHADLDRQFGEEGHIIAGSPASVRERLARLLELTRCDYVACNFSWGSLTHEEMLRSMQLFADEVMPAFTPAAAAASG